LIGTLASFLDLCSRFFVYFMRGRVGDSDF
jgi:hypothetical protein